MFEVGFSELLVIFVLALIVLGPEKLPRLAAQVGRWIGRARAMAKQFRDQLEEEVNVAEANKWKAKPQPPPSSEPPPATSAEPSASATPAAEPDSTTHSTAGTPPPQMHTGQEPPASHEAGSTNGVHQSGPPPEPEASLYEPPAYSSSGASPSTASPAPAPNSTPTEPHAPSHPPATSDDPPLRPGDVVTTTHERGI
jgi:sec-independent protein translocase protein TatB